MLRIVALTALIHLYLVFAMPYAEASERGPKADRHTAARYTESGPEIDIPRLEMKIHDLINLERRKRGLSPLSWSSELNRIARRFSADMADRGFFSHLDPEGKSFIDRYSDAGFACRTKAGNRTCLGAENIAQDNLYRASRTVNGRTFHDWNSEDEIARSVVRSWMESRGHRENILTPYLRQQGIGIAISGFRVYVTENFC